LKLADEHHEEEIRDTDVLDLFTGRRVYVSQGRNTNAQGRNTNAKRGLTK
jgi:hypothetical protein